MNGGGRQGGKASFGQGALFQGNIGFDSNGHHPHPKSSFPLLSCDIGPPFLYNHVLCKKKQKRDWRPIL